MTREERLELLKQIEKDIHVCSLESTFLEDAKSCAIHSAIEELEQEPTTKNDLGVDCISREQALVAIRNLYPGMPRVDFNGSLRKWVDKYKPYIECDDAIEQLPSVTPQEPRKGHWILDETDNSITCDKCGCLIWANDISNGEAYYCPNCGADMREVEE